MTDLTTIFSEETNFIVLKFGGSSVAEVNHWDTIASQAQYHLEQGNKPVLVLSALKNVSNLLEALLHQALAGVHPNAITHLKELHLGFAAKLSLAILDKLTPVFERIEIECEAIYSSQEISPKRHAAIVSCGELLSTLIGEAYLTKAGLNPLWFDAREILKATNHSDEWHHYTSAQCNYTANEQVRQKLLGQDGPLITQGFIASDECGDTVLLGREGSDTSASYFGAILNAAEVQIWTDVTGIFSSNPREINNTQAIQSLSYEQANQMARLGAKVLHPRAVTPAQKNNIPLRVKCTSEPDHPGTLISNELLNEQALTAIVYEPETTLIKVLSKSDDSEKKLENNSKEQTVSRLSSILNALGYDPLLNSQQQDTLYSIWIYANSDQPKMNDQSLKERLQDVVEEFNNSLSVDSSIGLISLIGHPDKVPQEVSEQSRLKLVENDLTFLMVDSKDCLKIAQKLHDQLI
ncbi:aspartate kinase [Aliikangiella sp. G2MR2-5]|uniref:aspartate kinase n=1 Tax=Aliikangiella sp. G2MR2-5 TaxID=2788943 RepID=UPI0018A8EE62|nr:aspartate kinase [Aliikangiella sp. G2MR2-5]